MAWHGCLVDAYGLLHFFHFGLNLCHLLFFYLSILKKIIEHVVVDILHALKNGVYGSLDNIHSING